MFIIIHKKSYGLQFGNYGIGDGENGMDIYKFKEWL